MPVIELAKRIRQNVEKMRKQKLKNKLDKIDENGKNSRRASLTIDLSITLLDGYKQQNEETHELF